MINGRLRDGYTGQKLNLDCFCNVLGIRKARGKSVIHLSSCWFHNTSPAAIKESSAA